MTAEPMPAGLSQMPVVFEAAADAPLSGKLVDFKARHARQFLAGGHKVKATVVFKGREITYKHKGEGILARLVRVDDSGLVNLDRVCAVAGLGGTPYRDGSYEYYIGEPRRTNDFKGYGPFLLAAIEVEKLWRP